MTTPEYTLELFTSVLDGQNFLVNVTEQALNSRRSIRLFGGYWRATFTLELELADLMRWFYNYLGCHFQERSGGEISWQGLVYEMTLDDGRVSRRRTLDEMYNHVRATYIDSNQAQQTTSAASQAQSIARYGRRENILSMDRFDQAPAEARRDAFLNINAWPWARPESGMLQEARMPSLLVAACGYVFTANWRYTTTADNSNSTISTWLKDIIDTDCQDYLRSGQIASNSTALKQTLDVPTRSWDLVQELVELGDSSGNPYRCYVENERYVRYQQIVKQPDYYIQKGQLTKTISDASGVNPWLVKPGVFRDLDYPIRRQEQGSWFDDARDFLTEEISVGALSGLSWRALEFDEAELLAAQQEYQTWLEMFAGPEAAAEIGGGRIRWGKILRSEGISWKAFRAMSQAQRLALRRKYPEWGHWN